MAKPIPKQYIKNFEQLGLGIFVHFGLYSLIGQGEWIACPEFNRISKEEYHKLTDKFNPGSMEELVKAIKKSGAGYITFTTRHHDGFSLYDTKGLNDFDSMHSAARRDIVKEFVDACRKYGIVPFFYHTTIEWWNDDYDNDFKKYLQYLRDSVEILCTNYGEIGGFWFDGCWAKPNDDWESDKLYEVIRKHQPNAVIINNTGLTHLGQDSAYKEIDSVTFERGKAFPIDHEGKEKYLAAEVCDSINDHWGIADDMNFKSPGELIEMLCRTRAAGANLLLNVGPKPDGRICEYSDIIMNIFGRWMNMYGSAIYNGRPCWFRQDEKNFILTDEKCAYLFAFDLPIKGTGDVMSNNATEYEYTFDDFKIKLKDIKWMDNGEVLEYSQTDDSLTVRFTGFDYGNNYRVRVAKAEISK